MIEAVGEADNIIKGRLKNMFDFFNKEKFKIVSSADGKLKSITSVIDEVFSSKALGDGFAIEPKQGIVIFAYSW